MPGSRIFERIPVKSISLPSLLASTGFSFAIGFGIAWSIPAPDYGLTPVAVPATTGTGNQQTGMNQLASLWSRNTAAPSGPLAAPSIPTASGPVSEEEKLRAQAKADPAALRKLIQRFDTERDPGARTMLKSVLAGADKPEVVALSSKLAASNDIARRKEAFELLQQTPGATPEARKLVRQALAGEQSAEVLTQALAALKPAVVEPAESEAIVAQLRNLTQNADPAVRSQSLMQLVQWDKNGSGGDTLSQALTDPAPQVRQAALAALAQSGMRSDAVKTALMGIIGNTGESREVRSSALQVLERFALNKEEFASYSQARSQVGL